MRNLPPFFLFLLASSTASPFSAAAAEPPAAPGPDASPLRPAATEAQPQESRDLIIEPLTGVGETEHNSEDGITYFRYGVIVRYQAMELVANQVALSEATGDIIADGNVRLQNDGQYWAGEHLEYNYKTGQVKGENFRAGLPPFFAGGFSLEGNFESHNHQADQTFFTTDDIKEPGFRVRAKQFRIIDGKRIEAKNASIVVGGATVMVLPVYKREMRSHETYWRVTPGYRSLFGPFMLATYHFPLTTNVSGGVKFDLYQKRGLGVGPDFTWNLPRWGEGGFQY